MSAPWPLARPLPTSPGEGDSTSNPTTNMVGDRAETAPNLENSSAASWSILTPPIRESQTVARDLIRFSPAKSSRPSPEASDEAQTTRSLDSNGGAIGGADTEQHSVPLSLGQSAAIDEGIDERFGQYVMLCIELFTYYKRRKTKEKEEQIAA